MLKAAQVRLVNFVFRQLSDADHVSRMQALGEAAFDALNYVFSSVWATSAAVFVATIIFLWLRSWLTYQPPVVLTYQPMMCGDITLETLSKYDGRDYLKPLYFAVRGKVYDVTKGKDFYGPGGCFLLNSSAQPSWLLEHLQLLTGAGYHTFAGKEVSRALAKMSLVEEDCNDKLEDLTKHQLDTLGDWETKFQEKYEVVGKVNFTLWQSAPCVVHPRLFAYNCLQQCTRIHDEMYTRMPMHL